ncbi:hypothetical protein GCM10023205_01920 [Yinghuangia aomiensis]|uniref:Uncharacterized protein n=1 Tax=Yinghuangia aomiensis TaxID=676205 RepID=A0ABP9GLR5_9ACTN
MRDSRRARESFFKPANEPFFTRPPITSGAPDVATLSWMIMNRAGHRLPIHLIRISGITGNAPFERGTSRACAPHAAAPVL